MPVSWLAMGLVNSNHATVPIWSSVTSLQVAVNKSIIIATWRHAYLMYYAYQQMQVWT